MVGGGREGVAGRFHAGGGDGEGVLEDVVLGFSEGGSLNVLRYSSKMVM
jgi:hypothetical protein